MTTTTTRSGRTVKKPVLYVPAEEKMTDDFSNDDYDSSSSESFDESVNESESVTLTVALSDESDSDADSNGNLKDFVVDSDDDDETRSDLGNTRRSVPAESPAPGGCQNRN